MKRFFLILTSTVTAAALACSCDEKPAEPDNKPDDSGDDVVENLIVVDGEFDDWKGLKGVAVAQLPDDEDAYPNLLTMKVVADKSNVYFYFEYQVGEETKTPFTLEIDADDDPDTGLTDYHWASAGWDYALESSAGFISATGFAKMNDLKLLKPIEGNDGQARTLDPSNCTSGTAKGVKNKGVRTNDIVKFELNVPRTLIKAESKGTINVGVYIENDEWKEIGILPIDDGMGMSEYLAVALP